MTTVKAEGHQWEMDLPPTKLGRYGRTVYEHELLKDIHAEGFTGSAFDVGAYYGNHSVYMAVVCGLDVHAFEPDAERLTWLRKNASRHENITVYPWAVGKSPGRASLVRGHKSAKYELLDSGEVPVYVIDDQIQVEDLSVVKLDIEGMEADALEGMVAHLDYWHPVIYSETHDDGDDQRAVLEPLGYRLEKVLRVPAPMWKWRWQ